MIRVCRLVLKPSEEVKGIMLDVGYLAANSAIHAHPALQVRQAISQSSFFFEPAPVSHIASRIA